jgi:diaminopimelate epimerase
VRTYERGVEDETFSCGTGVTAAAIVHAYTFGHNQIAIQTKGGALRVEFEKKEADYQNIWLIGPAVKVFEGTIEL